MKKKILFFIIITFLSLAIHLQSDEDKCNPSTPSSPGGDQPDENLSYSNGSYNIPIPQMH